MVDPEAIRGRIEQRRVMGGRAPDVPPTLLAMEQDIDDLLEEVDRLRRVITEHRTAIHNAGAVRVADYDSAGRAETKHAADQRLWEALDA